MLKAGSSEGRMPNTFTNFIAAASSESLPYNGDDALHAMLMTATPHPQISTPTPYFASLYMFQEVQLPALAPALLVDNNFDGHRVANVLVGGTVHDTIRPSGDFAVQTIFSTQRGCLGGDMLGKLARPSMTVTTTSIRAE